MKTLLVLAALITTPFSSNTNQYVGLPSTGVPTCLTSQRICPLSGGGTDSDAWLNYVYKNGKEGKSFYWEGPCYQGCTVGMSFLMTVIELYENELPLLEVGPKAQLFPVVGNPTYSKIYEKTAAWFRPILMGGAPVTGEYILEVYDKYLRQTE